MEQAIVSVSLLRRQVDPWVAGALVLGTFTFLAMPYTLYVMTVVAVYALAAALVFLILSPAIPAFQYLRYRRGSRPLLQGGG